MFNDFAVAFSEMGLRKWQIITMSISFIVFPITFLFLQRILMLRQYMGG